MLKIEVKKVDELYWLLSELKSITYLQKLLHYEVEYDSTEEFRCANDYLFDKQYDTVSRLRELLENNFF